ncbi:MAG: hypothetical protein Q9191_005282, partial [Dirinaria sp. TL-2023a]
FCATGANTDLVPPFPILCRGLDLQEAWKTSGKFGFPYTYLGLATPGFPNLLFIGTAHLNGASGTLPHGVEIQTTYYAKLLRKALSQHIKSMEPLPEAANDFLAYSDAFFATTVLTDNCSSWANGGRPGGRVHGLWPGSAAHCTLVRREPRWEDWKYEYNAKSGNRFAYFGNEWTKREQDPESNMTAYLKLEEDNDLRFIHEGCGKRSFFVEHALYFERFEQSHRFNREFWPNLAWNVFSGTILGPTMGDDPAYVQGRDSQSPAQSLKTSFSEAVRENGDLDALVCLYQNPNAAPNCFGGKRDSERLALRWTYKELCKDAQKLAVWFSGKSIRRGDRILTFLESGAEFTVTLWAAALLRACLVPLDPRSINRSQELKHYLAISQPSAVFVANTAAADAVEQQCAEQVKGIKALIIAQDEVRETKFDWHSIIKIIQAEEEESLGSQEFEAQDDRNEDLEVVIFTSGTTSLPKGCAHTTRTLWQATKSTSLSNKSNYLLVSPSFHILGLWPLIQIWRTGGKVVIPLNRQDPQLILGAIESERITLMLAVPTALQALLDYPSLAQYDLSSLTRVATGGTVVSPKIIKGCTDSSGLGAERATGGYGMTEGSPIFYPIRGEQPALYEGYASVGRITSMSRAKICRPGTRQTLCRGEVGELHIGGSRVISGYLGMQSEEFYIDDHGCNWLVTGDRAMIDASGNAFILGRYKDLIIRGGENISPAAVELCLGKIAAIREVQVVGVPDEIAGEVPIAIIQMDFGSQPSVSALRSHVTRELGSPSTPTKIFTLDDLGLIEFPSNAAGKIKKNTLRRIVQDYVIQHDRPIEIEHDKPSLELSLVDIWSQLLSIPSEKLSQTRDVLEEADSLITLQFQSSVRKRFKQNFSLLELQNHRSIQDQARYLDGHSTHQGSQDMGTLQFVSRTGPPNITDMAHAHGDSNRAQRTKEMAEPLLRQFGLKWDVDVEDVLPIPDFTQHQLQTRRLHSWTWRFSFLHKSTDPTLLYHAISKSLSAWPMFRSIHMIYDEETQLFLAIRASERWCALLLSPMMEVNSVRELQKLQFPPPRSVRSPGPLFRAAVVRVRETQELGLVTMIQHSLFDAVSLPAWIEDVNNLLLDRQAMPNPNVPFKVFADMYYNHSTSLLSQSSAAYHASRLRGLSQLKACCWPPRRAPGSFIGDDADWTYQDGSVGRAEDRKALNANRSLGIRGASASINLPDIRALKTQHGISAAMVLKSACVLFNLAITGQETALFSAYQAARQWPFVEDFLAQRLPDPLFIAGPTWAAVINLITPNPRSTILELLQTIEDDQSLLTQHSQAPLNQIKKLLSASDSAAFDEALAGQCFNWLPEWKPSGSTKGERDVGKLKAVHGDGLSDRSVVWRCRLEGETKASVWMRYDDCQLSHEQAERAVRGLKLGAEWICDKNNWERSVGECLESLRSTLEIN